jgi:hypothetical protein
VAAEYAAVADVDPRVGEHLLDVLGLQGIAAYLHPSTDQHPVTRSSTLPARPVDRLFVDRAHVDTAREYLARLAADDPAHTIGTADPVPPGPSGSGSTGTGGTGTSVTGSGSAGPGGPAGPGTAAVPAGATPAAGSPEHGWDNRDLEEAWSQIVAGFDTEVEPPQRSWPAAEDVPAGEVRAAPRWPVDVKPTLSGRGPVVDPPPAGPVTPADGGSLLDGLDTFGAGLPDDEEEGYTPPPAPPIPRPSLPSALGVAGIVGGLVVFLRPALLPMSESTAMMFGVAAIVAGFTTLVWRLRPGDDEDDTPDDGARV